MLTDSCGEVDISVPRDRDGTFTPQGGHLTNEQSAMKTLYLVTWSLDPKGTGQKRLAMRWKPALNAFAITFDDRMPAAQDR